MAPPPDYPFYVNFPPKSLAHTFENNGRDDTRLVYGIKCGRASFEPNSAAAADAADTEYRNLLGRVEDGVAFDYEWLE